MDTIIKMLQDRKDENNADFQAKLIPTVSREKFLGLRAPVTRALVKDLLKDEYLSKEVIPNFLNELPHWYFDENSVHADIISKEKDFDRAIELTEKFLPYIDNWAVCDSLDPKVFGKHKAGLFVLICKWLESDKVYTVRFGIDMMIKHFLDREFKQEHLYLVLNAKGDDYYIKMAKAWYFSFAFIKQYDETFAFFKSAEIDDWTFKKSIQKARESYRIADDRKDELKAMLKHE